MKVGPPPGGRTTAPNTTGPDIPRAGPGTGGTPSHTRGFASQDGLSEAVKFVEY
ncbi:uncharacterized protein MYCFIDRAFT_210701 [Pseudocercospora fijiensis CIRAD86]|uniref:Uncharacterized protein n=1 Tax=Pseudocercospora fijiensis (strain CIRAD86) TaxID=383855 RepID=M3B325_PSEFD|nr:uncharacterized protein MYCFIDRAFT_210701 [Pseudocercospora fijiensis CIRAD86]EME83773.1 hypothetical protein MYCFIDRAFT_210701 [Pseudocercospora fijiensis CIRAD86]